jgi:hypothetical protein
LDKLIDGDQQWVNENQIDIWAAAHRGIGQLMTRLGNKQ